MAGLQTSGNSLITSQSPFILDVGAAISSLQAERTQEAGFLAQALEDITNQISYITQVLQGPMPSLTDFVVTSPVDGSLIFWAGWRSANGTAYAGAAASNLWIGPGADPTTAPFFSDGTQVAIGQNGSVSILDPNGDVGAWLGTQSEAAKTVTGAANNGSGAIRITVAAHGYGTGDTVIIASVGGTTEANGSWIITVFDANNFDLDGSAFVHAYTSGGTSTRFYAGGLFGTVAVGAGKRITGVADNGAGLIRVTVVAHGYSTGYEVVITGAGGVPAANGYWLVTVIDADHFDLIGSAFSGLYTSGGVSLNWPTAKLLAKADGSLSVTNAEIIVNSNGITTTLNNQVYGGQVVGLTLQTNATPNQSATVFPKGFSLENAAGDFVGSFATSNSDPPGSGTFRLADGSGAGGLDGLGSTIFLTGVDGKVQCSQIQVSGGLGINKTIHGVDTSLGVNGLTLGTTTITYVTSINFVAQTYTTGSTTVVVSGSLSTADSIFTGGVVTS